MKFSVTIPAYKATFLKECIDSVLAQTYTDFELIIVNDCSPEDLDSIVLSYSDKRIHYLKNTENFGAINVVDNWNKCLDYATGEYIICMGDDDKLLPCCLDEYSSLINRYPGLGVYHAWTEIIDENSDVCQITASRCEYESVYSLIWHRWDNRKKQYIGDFLFDVTLLRNNGGFFKMPLAWGSDDISAVIAAIPFGIANTQKLCFCYRINSQSISNSDNSEIKLQSILEEENWYTDFLKKEPKSLLDIKFWRCIKQMLPHHFEKKKGIMVSRDLKCHGVFRLIHWIANRRKYKLSIKCIIYALVVSLKTR